MCVIIQSKYCEHTFYFFWHTFSLKPRGGGGALFQPSGIRHALSTLRTWGSWTTRCGTVSKCRSLVLHPGQLAHIRCCAFSPNGEFLALGSGDQTASLWRMTDHGKPVKPQLHATLEDKAHQTRIASCCFSPDSLLLCLGLGDNYATIWSVGGTSQRSEEPVKKIHDIWLHNGPIRCCAFLPTTGRSLLCLGSQDGTASLVDLHGLSEVEFKADFDVERRKHPSPCAPC